MKQFSRYFAVMMLVVALLVLFGCEKQSPLSDIESETSPQLQFIPLGKANGSLNKIVSVSGWVTKQQGGMLILHYKGSEHNNGNVDVKITLKVFANSISEDSLLFTLSLDDQYLAANVDVTFDPHGVVFTQPALLDIQAKNLDLSGIDSTAIGVYYDDTSSGQWEEMVTRQVIVKDWQGFINIIDGEIPHFSRYAVAISQ